MEIGDPAAAVSLPGDPCDTRTRVVRELAARGRATVPELAEALGLTQAAVRRHLDVLLAEGAAEPAPRIGPIGATGPRGRGRPARHLQLTDAGRALLPSGYEDLAGAALAFLAEQGGPDAVRTFARQRAQALAAAVDAAPDADAWGRAQALASVLTTAGFAASAEQAPGGAQVCQHHCPVAHVAAQFPQLCEAETEAFAEVLGSHVQRLATIAHGDGVCTTHVPAAAAVGNGNGTTRGTERTSA